MKQIFCKTFLLTCMALCGVIVRPVMGQEVKPIPERPVRSLTQETDANDPRERLPELPAREVMKYARLLYFEARSSLYKPEKLERELLKRKEFGDMGLEITREKKHADLVLEITRKRLTTRFTCAMIEPHSVRVVGGVTASSLGGEIEPHLAEAIIKEFKAARAK